MAAEIARAQAAEAANAAAISAEEVRALAAEATLTSDLAQELVDRADGDSVLQALADKHESSIGLDAAGSFPGFGASNYMITSTTLMGAVSDLDVQVAANEGGLTSEISRATGVETGLNNRLTAMESKFGFTGDAAQGGALVLTDGGDVVTMTFAVVGGVKQLTIS